MKEVFKYTFLTTAEIKKFALLVIIASILTIIQAFPVISIVSFLVEKMLYLSVGALLIFLVQNSTEETYFTLLKKQPLSTFLLHFLPTAMGILTALFVITSLFTAFFIMILKFTNSVFILANPHEFMFALSKTPFVTKVLIGFYSVYMIFYSYIFLGKFAEALSKEGFKDAFLSMLSSIIDFKFWIRSFNLKYMVIYFVWSFIILAIYSVTAVTYLFYIFPLILTHPNLGLLMIPLLVAIVTILSYFTFFSAYFAYKTTKD